MLARLRIVVTVTGFMSEIEEFSQSEEWMVKTALKERYGEEKPFERAETEMRLNPLSSEMTPCSAIYWEHEGCHFIVVKLGDRRYKAQFFYRVHKMYGTGIEEFTDIAECVVTLLQVQADYVADNPDAAERDG